MLLRVNDVLSIHQIENNQWIIVNQKSGKTAVKLECGFIQVFHFAIPFPASIKTNFTHSFKYYLQYLKTGLFAWSVFPAFNGTFCTFVIESTYSKGIVFDLRVLTIDPDETIFFTFHRNHLLYWFVVDYLLWSYYSKVFI